LRPGRRAATRSLLALKPTHHEVGERAKAYILSPLHSSYRDDVVAQHMHFHIRILENYFQHIRN
jgi:hypothetical protein